MGTIIILDIETQELVPEDRNLKELRISFAGIRIDDGSREDGTGQDSDAIPGSGAILFSEAELPQLFKLLDDAELIVGHNLLRFDYKVLGNYAHEDLAQKYRHKTFDIQHCLLRKTDRLIPLNDLAQRNLGLAKNGKGADAPMLFKEGRHDELKAYLAQDLLVTHQLFDHIRRHGKVKYGLITYKEPVEREVFLSVDER
jgi:DEAD/DEAH box helicase domain-containing protein